jgi:hypothetical protein
MIPYEDLCAEVRRLRQERWAAILAGEPSGRPPGRRPRDPEQEELLLQRDRERLEERLAARAGPGQSRDATARP